MYVTDINDTPPKFNQDDYSITISEGTPIGTPIIVVTATDLDIVNDEPLTYSWYDEANSGEYPPRVSKFNNEYELVSCFSTSGDSASHTYFFYGYNSC